MVVAQEPLGGLFRWCQSLAVREEVAEFVIAVFTYGGFKRHRLLAILENVGNLLDSHLDTFRDLLDRRLAVVLLRKFARGASDLVQRLVHVDRDTDLFETGRQSRVSRP